MLNINKTYFYLFLFILVIQIPCLVWVKSSDEFGVLLLLCLAGLDMLFNGCYRKYKGLLLVVGVFTFYLGYTLLFHHFNIPTAVFTDYIIQMKPFVPFMITYAIAPTFGSREKAILKKTCLIIAVVLLVTFVTGLVEYVVAFVTYLGIVSMLCFAIYLYCSLDEHGQISKKDLYRILFILLVSLTSTRSKIFGEFVMALYLLFLYKPGTFRKFNWQQIALTVMAGVALIVVSWGKIEYYFITGATNIQNFEDSEAFARPVLYGCMGLILMDYPIFGSGLGSFATFASTPDVNYSSLYYDYGISNVWGLSEQMPLFICDAFYPTLAQFGFVGIALVLFLFMWIYKQLRVVLHKENRILFVVGVMMICCMAIESVAGTMVIQGGGVMAMMILGLVVSKYKNLSKQEKQEILDGGYANVEYELIKK